MTVTTELGYDQYLIRRQMFKLFGGAYRIYDPSGQLAFYVDQKAFRLRDDIRMYTDESMQTEALVIKARQMLDWAACFDVFEAGGENKIGALKRRWLKSMIRDEWAVMDAADNDIGVIREDRLLLALLRRWVTRLLPRSYDMQVDDALVGRFKQNFNPFTLKLRVDFSLDPHHLLDKRLGLAAGVLLSAVDGRQR